jgi:hypothetical protein
MVAPSTKKESSHNVEFAEGGDGHMFGPQKATPDKPGNTGHDTGGGGNKFAKGGSGKMFGFSPAGEAKSGITGPR